MRNVLGPRSSLILATAGSLFLAACQSDVPTSANPGGGTGPLESFSLLPGAAEVAKGSTHHFTKSLPTLARRQVPASSLSGGDNGNVNSPFDLSYLGGALVNRATNWNLYVNCPSGPADCWGSGNLSPGTFLRDLNRSSFIQIANQYLGNNAAGRFPVNELSGTVPIPGSVLTDDDIIGIVYSVAQAKGAVGYGNIFHVFLPAGIDECFDASLTVCYSPDNYNTFYYCAYHSSFDDAAGNHYLYSVEPYQYTPGCVLPGQAPHGPIDATASTLSHEFFETITDPDGSSWWNLLTGNEIGDLCSPFGYNERLGYHSYVIQTEYSNAIHNCTDQS